MEKETEINKYVRLVTEERERRKKLGENTFSFKPVLINNNGNIEFQGKMSDGNLDISDFFIRTENIDIYEKNILSYKVLIQLSNGKYKLNQLEIFDNKNLSNAIFILTKVEDTKYFTIIYKGNKKILEEESEREYFLSYPYERILFSKFSSSDGLFDYYEFSYITLNKHFLGKSVEGRVSLLRMNYARKMENFKEKININKRIKLDEKQNIHFVISRRNNKWIEILLYFCKCNLINVKKMENQFSDDLSENYIIEIDKNKKNEISFIDYCCKMGDLYGISIYEKPLHVILYYLSNSIFREDDVLFQKVYFYSINKELEMDSRDQYLDIISQIKQKLHQKDIQEIVNKLNYIEYTRDNCENLINKFLTKNNIYVFSMIDYINKNVKEKILEDYIKTANEIFDTLVDNGVLDVTWKNEYKLYRLIKKHFAFSVYQYKPRWLVPQSLDIYIPEINLGVEYQGEQHFKSIDFFGGDSGLEIRQKRDENKKIICEKNKVKLLEWNYNIEVNEENLKKEFLRIGLKI